MNVKEIIGITVLDKNANEVGKVSNMEFNKETGKIENVVIDLRKNILSNSKEISIEFDNIATIGQYILLKEEIAEEEVEEEKEEEKVEVTVE